MTNTDKQLENRGSHPNSKKNLVHGFKKGLVPWNKGKKTGVVPKGAFKKGQTPWNKGLPKEQSHLYGKKHSLERINKARIGIKNYFDKKGRVSSQNRLARTSTEYKLWRTAVFERDNYTCIWCGDKKTYLNADHIKPFAIFPELRFAIDNGRTLCQPCHQTTDTFGWKLYNNRKLYEKK